MRTVVVLCGPPGAGKTTAARASGLDVYDRDDPQWQGESDFVQALEQLGRAPAARAVVIRSGATSTARLIASSLVAATHVFVLLQPRDELIRRVIRRGREDQARSVAGVDRWLTRCDWVDGVAEFPGWEAALAPPPIGMTSTDW